MSRIIQIQHKLDCNKWTCGRCEHGSVLASGRCELFFGPIRDRDENGEGVRLPECLAAEHEAFTAPDAEKKQA